MSTYSNLHDAASELILCMNGFQCDRITTKKFFDTYTILWPRFVEATENASLLVVNDNFVETVKHFVETMEFNAPYSKTINTIITMYNVSYPKLKTALANFLSRNTTGGILGQSVVHLIKNLVNADEEIQTFAKNQNDCSITIRNIPGTIWAAQREALNALRGKI